MSIPKVSSSEITCDLKELLHERDHNINTNGLQKDPLGRIKITPGPDNTILQETMRLCDSCYRESMKAKQIQSGRICGLSTPDAPHPLTKRGLLKDPLGRPKTSFDAMSREPKEIIDLCQKCYEIALAKLQSEKGLSCDLATANNPHDIGNRPLRSDPLERKKTADSEEIMQLCNKCYQRAIGEKTTQEGFICDLSTAEQPHKITCGPLTDPLKRKKEIIDESGNKIYKTMSLCIKCYNSANAEKQRQETRVCDLKTSLPLKQHTITSAGLIKDPLGRKKTKDSNEVMTLCRSCYYFARKEKLQCGDNIASLSSSDSPKADKDELICDLSEQLRDRVHRIDRNGLQKDPLRRIKITPGPNNTTLEEPIKLCNSCYSESIRAKQTQDGRICGLSTPDAPHPLTKKGLTKDPLGRPKTPFDAMSRQSKEIIELCQKCYMAALAENQRRQGLSCGLSTPDNPHDIGNRPLVSDPLKRPKSSQDSVKNTAKETMLLCQQCYEAAIKTRRTQQKDTHYATSSQSHSILTSSALPESSENEPSFNPKRRKQVSPADSSAPLASAQADDESPLRVLAEAAELLSAQPIFVKEEPQDDTDCVLISRKIKEHTVDNHRPILQHPKDPMQSLLSEVENDIDTLRVTNWGGINATKEEKEKILKQARQWIRLNEYDIDAFARRLDELMEVSIPVDDLPLRGRSVFAKRTIQKFEVLGPYAGALLRTQRELDDSIRKTGSYPVLSYLYATNSQSRTIDGYSRGNVTSLINTGSMPGQQPIANNNVASIVVGKNLVFLVSIEVIAQGAELFLDYGDTYNPMQYLKTEKRI